MKKYAVSLFILVSFFMNGCEDYAANNNPSGEAQKQVTEESNKQAETKKQPAKQNQVKSVVNKQTIEVSSKLDDKPPQSETENNPEIAEQVQDQKALDLSPPLKIPETKDSGNTSSHGKRNYLPDLFTDQKDQKNKSIQVDGKIIRREEEEAGKYRVEDGVGIDIKLDH